MKCPYCKNEIENDSKFCTFCGNAINKVDNKKEKGNNKIKILLVVAGLLWIAQLISIAIYNQQEYFYIPLISYVGIIVGLFVLLGLFIHNKYLQDRNITITRAPNGKKPGTLGRVLGIGVLMIGRWRKYADTYVGYSFIIFVLPLFPLGCYRYKIVKTDLNSITYNFYWSEEWSGKEVFCIYSYFYGGIIWSISLIIQLFQFFQFLTY